MTDLAQLRHEQGDTFEREDFAAHFAVCERLAAADAGYGRSYGHWLHTVLHELARTTPGLRFLQVGGMDGKRFDPVYAFIKHYRWSGLILEPLPDLFAALSAHYTDCPGVTLVNAALRERDGTEAMLRVSRDAARTGAVPGWAEGLGSFHPERNALGGVGVDPALHAALLLHARHEAVDCVTVRALAGRWGLDRVDLLQVDAEGCELDILRQVDAAGYRPRVVQLEHWALTPAERGAVLGLLGERGYSLRMGESDVLAVDAALGAAVDR